MYSSIVIYSVIVSIDAINIWIQIEKPVNE